MKSWRWRSFLVLGLAWSVGPCQVRATAQENLPVRAVLETLEALHAYDRRGRPASERIAFELPESVVNSYLAYSLKAKPRPALDALVVRFPTGNVVAAEAAVDLDALSALESLRIPEALRPQLKGRRPVKAEFRIRVETGRLTFEVQPSSSGESGFPPGVLGELVRALAALQPEHLDTTAPIPLPYGLRRLSVGPQGLAGDTR